jgi:MFS transporter, ACS family, allantoate permease
MIVCYVVAIICILAYGGVCHLSNKQRAEEIAAGSHQDWLDVTDKENRSFVYTT